MNTAETSSDPPIPIPENPTVLWTGGALYEYVGEYMPGDYEPGGRNYIEIPENERWEKEFPCSGIHILCNAVSDLRTRIRQ